MKKSSVISALNEFPKEVKLDEFFERLIVLQKIEEGLRDVKEGKVVSHAGVKKAIAKW
jgi:predicted transcriptional regulator